MNRTEKKKLTRAIHAAIPSLFVKGSLLALVPRGNVLRGISFQNSSSPDRIYIWSFVQPLYIPSDVMYVTLGDRIGGPSRTWSINDVDGIISAIREKGIPLIEKVDSPENIVKRRLVRKMEGVTAYRAIAYSLIYIGEHRKGLKNLTKLIASAEKDNRDWVKEQKKLDVQLAFLAKNEPEKAIWLLKQWEVETAKAIGVDIIP